MPAGLDVAAGPDHERPRAHALVSQADLLFVELARWQRAAQMASQPEQQVGVGSVRLERKRARVYRLERRHPLVDDRFVDGQVVVSYSLQPALRVECIQVPLFDAEVVRRDLHAGADLVDVRLIVRLF